MEGIIMMVIVFVISSLFGKLKDKDKDQKKPTKQMPPFSNQTAPRQRTEARPDTGRTRQPKSLEDFANEIFGQLNDKSQQSVEPKPVVQVEIPKPAPVEVVKTKREELHRTSTRKELRDRPIVQKLKKQEAQQVFQVVPTSQKQVMQAIIMSEVLGPPKAKRS